LVKLQLLKITVFWDVAPCSLVEVCRRFRGAYCLHHQPIPQWLSKLLTDLHETWSRQHVSGVIPPFILQFLNFLPTMPSCLLLRWVRNFVTVFVKCKITPVKRGFVLWQWVPN
jgi:hypothetical protein